MGRLSVIVPVLDEAAIIIDALRALESFRRRGVEIVVADGGSRDGTPDLARPFADRIVATSKSRGGALNAGAAHATGNMLLFLHADTRLPEGADRLIAGALRRRAWGRFDLRIAGRHPLLAMVARMITWRSRATGIATGDQAIFVRRDVFTAIGGFPDLPLMEDIALSRRLKRLCRPACIATPAVTSGRRWDHHGVVRTILLMWQLRLAYYFGAKPARLARRYRPVPPSVAQGRAGP